MKQGKSAHIYLAPGPDPIDDADLEGERFIKTFFKGNTKNSVVAIADVAGNALALIKPSYCRGRLMPTYELIYIPQGSRYRIDQNLLITQANIPIKFDRRESMIFSLFNRLGMKQEKNYLPFVQKVFDTLGNLTPYISDAVSVPGGFVARCSMTSDEPRGIWQICARAPSGAAGNKMMSLKTQRGTTVTAIQVGTNGPSSQDALYDEAIKLQLQSKNTCMHTPSFRLASCTLDHAMANEAHDQACALIGMSGDINYMNIEGRTPLHEATWRTSDLSIFKALLKAGSDPHSTDSRGHSPLHMAIIAHDSTATQRLLLSGVVPASVFGSIAAAIQFCERWDTHECAHIIRAHHSRAEALRAIQSICDELNLGGSGRFGS